MEKQSPKEGLLFKDFLDKSTNLITVFGVLNALFIYSAQIDEKHVAIFLLPTFFVLSILVWLELIFFAIDSSNGSIKYEIFYFSACIIELGLIWYFSMLFSPLLVALGLISILFLLAYGIMHLILRFTPKFMIKHYKKRKQLTITIILIVSCVIAGLIIKLIAPILEPLIKIIPFEKSIPKF